MACLETLVEYLALDFVRSAFLSCALVSFATALLGTVLVLRRLSYIGDGLSHVAFGAMAVGAATGLAGGMAAAIPVAAVCAVFLSRCGRDGKVRGDAALAMMSVAALALGYLLMNLKPGSPNVSGDVCTTLFGSVSIVTLDEADVWLSAGVSLAAVLFFAVFRHRIFETSFDPDFARSCGTNTVFWQTAVAVLSAVVIVVAMKLVGALLVSALVVFPAVTAMRLCKSFRATLVAAAAISVFTAVTGLTAAILAGTPAGATMVTAGAVVLVAVSAVSRFI